MNNADRYMITSNEFADLIIRNNGPIKPELEQFPTNKINNQYSTKFIPVSDMTYDSVNKFTYIAIPKCYGLLTYVNIIEETFSNLHAQQLEELSGYGVLIGIIDTGIDYRNPLFRNDDKTTRIASIWDQTINSNNYPEGLYYGTEYSAEQINQALFSDDPLSIVPSMDDIGHGTILAGIAGGRDLNNLDFAGLAPYADFAVVKLKPAKPYLKEFTCIPESALCYQENDIMMGITYLKSVAEKLNCPIVICIGMGTSQGAHMGRCILCDYIIDLNKINGYAIAVAAGNEGNRGHHIHGAINPELGQQLVELNVAENEYGFSMEFWGNAPNVFGIDIIAPTGELVSSILPTFIQQNTEQVFFDNTVITIDNRTREIRVDDNLILLRFQNPMSGKWQFNIWGNSDLTMEFHIWLPIENFILEGTYFNESNNNMTLVIPANVEWVTSATAYNQFDMQLYYYASRGFTKTGVPKPDITAPGVNLKAPFLDNMFVNVTGTGAASAYVTGVIALLLEWGIVKGNLPSMNGIDINRLLIRGATRFPNSQYPNPDTGYGILNLDLLKQNLIKI